jgi:ribosome biogenesis GTPase A
LSKYLWSIDGMKQMTISPATSRALTTNCVIPVVGVTGSGKSSFIKRVTKQKDVKVGAGLFYGEILNKTRCC